MTEALEIPKTMKVNLFKLEEANKALDQLRAGDFEGSAVLVMPVLQKEEGRPPSARPAVPLAAARPRETMFT